jgi:hypothetical protein
MLRSILLIAAFLNSFEGFSQRSHVRPEGFSLKTDVLALFNSAVEKGTRAYQVSGEFYFNEAYSLNLEFGEKGESIRGLSRKEKMVGSSWRWYFKQDDCSCSSFFTGCYFNAVHLEQFVDQQYLHNTAVSYNRTSLEAGLCGGYQALFSEHFVIDPSVRIGMEFYHHISSTDEISYYSDTQDVGILLQVLLGVGYRF